MKKFGWWISVRALSILLFFVRIVPELLLPKLGNGLGILAYHILGPRRKTALKNMRMVFGSTTSEKEKHALIKANFKSISRDMLEFAYYSVPPRLQSFLERNISVRGQEHLDRALKKGKGVILLSAHIGNFPIIGAKMAARGYSFWLIAKDPDNIYLVDLFRQWKDILKIGAIPYKPRRVCVNESLKLLRNNNIIFLQIDQNPHKRSGTDVEFFGYQIPTYSGPIVMALRTGAAIVPMFIHREENNTETITILPELSLKRSNDKDQDIVDNLRSINAICEGWIRKYPEQWWWIHRRFRRARKVSVQ
ncbi:MAG: hypothetical protein J7M06_06000 [Proteobacteria bacterium]|nr:hypothetical protein [Pseudomonadota bacterium]